MIAYYELYDNSSASLGLQIYRVYFEIEITATTDIDTIESRMGITILRE